MASAPNVLCDAPETISLPRSLFGRPASRSYRAAVAQVIRNAKAVNRLSNERLGELLGCSEQTVANAENEVGDLTAVILFSLAYAFGEDAIDPVRELYLCAAVEKPTPAQRIDRANREIAAALSELEQA